MYYRLLFICFFLTGCAAGRMVETSLYFGMAIPEDGMVTQKNWNDFKEKQISAVFKEGSTIIDAQGNWRDTENGKLITEPTHIVIYYHKNTQVQSRRIDSLREVYKRMFKQQSVLRVDKKAGVSFYVLNP